MRSALLLSLIAVTASPALAQTSRVEGGSTSLGGIVFYYETRLEPPVPPLDSLSMVVLTTPPATVHRVMLDRARKIYFGYDAQLSVLRQGTWAPGGGGPVIIQRGDPVYQLALGPLSMTAELEKILGPDAAGWKQMPTPRFGDALAQIRAGEAIEITMLANTTSRQRLTEYVTVGEAPRQGFNAERPREFVFAGGNPRDFTAADVVLTLTEARVSWTSPTGSERVARGDASGGILWVYVPNAGRFLLSLVPRRGFVRAGSVRGTSMTFQMDGNTYSINSATRIAPGDSAFNLYVLRQPAWKPTFAHADLDAIHLGAADRAEYLVGK